ncbi:hypothetical protein Bca101_063970 [Brassica carinata]
MTDNGDEARVPPSDSATANDASRTRQRRKRKWDQPAEQLVAAGVVLPPANTVAPLFQTLPHALPKLIQDELTIAREIVINDAEASLRHKLTKRSTQEEYRPPNALPDGEKPLYLHISAAAHLKETTERILAVDRAAAMVEEMMKQKTNSQVGLVGSQTVKVYGAVPPPQQLLAGTPNSENAQTPNLSSAYGLMTSLPIIPTPNAVNPVPLPPATTLYPQFPVLQQPLGNSNGGHLRPSPVSYIQPVAGGTSYSGYAGIYPQATPLQQVAQVLRQSVSPVMSTVPPTLLTAASLSKPNYISSEEKERRPPQKRKFQELPADCKVPAKSKEKSELAVAGEIAPKNIAEPRSNGVPSLHSPRSLMPPPPPKTIPPPPSRAVSPPSSRTMLPPPPRFSPSKQPPAPRLQEDQITIKKPIPVPDTLIKLMEYGDDEDDDED